MPIAPSPECEFIRIADRCVCRHCGLAVIAPMCDRLHARCTAANNRGGVVLATADVGGLGTVVESILSSVGVTQDRYVAFKTQFGLLPQCDCDERREWLNRLGETFGNNAKRAVQFALGILGQ